MKTFYVVGSRASKSLSPTIFNYWFKKYKIKASYDYLECDEKHFDKKIKETLKKNNLRGLNITIPFKKKIMKHVDVLDKHSKKIKAVNCLLLKNKIKGYNTDWIGYYETLPKKINPKKNKVILIGYGGAALAIHYVLQLNGFKEIMIFNRSKKKINFEKKIKYTIPLNKLNLYLSCADIIINTTPKNPIKDKDKGLVSSTTLLSDIVYNPKKTTFCIFS